MVPTGPSQQRPREVVLNAIHSVAPEVDLQSIRADQPLREQIDIDSMDFLNILLRVHRALGVDIPEADYAKIATIDAFVAYLASKLSTTQP